MYENDSFLTLSMSERIGLVCVTLALSLFVIYAYRALSFKRSFGIRIGLAFVCLYLFVWLSPQAYYQYYLQIFDFLEFKNVIHSPPNPIVLLKLLTFTESDRLSHHGQGILGWILINMSFWPGRKNITSTSSPRH
tara:strand:+ start:281 stop:685 length:405 start_codon:yes stop_codon:yes gene_type:complete